MNTAMNIAASGLSASSAQYTASAAKIVADTTTKAVAGGNLAADIVGATMAADSFRANVAVMKTADKMMGTLLDTLA